MNNQSNRNILNAGGLVLCLAALPQNAHAQDNPAVAEVEQITVTGKRTAFEDSYTAPQMSTAVGLPLAPKDTPQSVSVITRKQMDDMGVTTLEEAVRNTTGINVYTQGFQTRYQSRGFDIAQISEDGVNSTICTMCGNNPHDQKQLTDTALYERIEIVRGATGLKKAQSEPGGSINAVRKRPTTKPLLEFETAADRFGTVRAAADVSGPLSQADGTYGRVVAVLERSNSFRKHTDGNKAVLYGVIDKYLGDDDKLTFGAQYQREEDTPPLFGLPAHADGSDLRLPRDTYLGASWNNSSYRKLNAFGEWVHHFNDKLKLTTLIDYKQNKSETRYLYVPHGSDVAADGTVSDGFAGRSRRYNHQWSFQTDLEGFYNAFGREHQLYAGYSYTREKFDNYWRGSRQRGSYPILTWTGNEVAQPDWESQPQEVRHTAADTHTLTLATRLNLTDKLHLLLGTAYSRWRQSQYLSWFADPNSHYRKGRFIPYAGITYDLTLAQSLYASYTSIFKNTTARDKDDRELDPVMGNSYEIGWKGAWNDSRLNTTLAVFQTEKHNEPVNTRQRHAVTNNWIFTPIPLRSRGIDAEIAGKITDNWQLFAGYTYNTRRYAATAAESTAERNGRGVDFSQHTPRHIFRAHTSYRLPGAARKWTLTGGFNIQSKSSPITVNGNKQYLGGYAVWNAGVQYEPNKNMRLSLKADNITDKRYYQSYAHRGTNQGHFYGEPRNISLHFKWKM